MILPASGVQQAFRRLYFHLQAFQLLAAAAHFCVAAAACTPALAKPLCKRYRLTIWRTGSWRYI